MANPILLPYTGIVSPHTSKRRHWRRYTTTIRSPSKHWPSLTHLVHNSTSNLPDIVNDCQMRQERLITSSQEVKLTCKEIAHSLRLVADQVDQKYCQVSVNNFVSLLQSLLPFQDADFHRHLHCLSLRFVFHSAHIRTILYTLWTRSFLPFILLVCKTKTFR